MIVHLRSLFFTFIFFGVAELIISFVFFYEKIGIFLAFFLIIF